MRGRTMPRLVAALLIMLLVAAGCSGGRSTPKLKPEDAQRVREEAVELIRSGNIEEAGEKLQQVTAATPKDARAQFLIGITYYDKGEFDQAVKAYNKAVELDPNFFEAYNNLGNTYRDMQRFDEAIAAYKKAIETSGTVKFTYPYSNLADLYMRTDRTAEAIGVLEAGVAANPDNLDLQMVLAGIYQEAGQKDKALGVLARILKTYPEYTPAKQMTEDISKK